MISKDELILNVAQSCGVSKEIASYFFEVFVNRLSNKLKPGDLLHYNNYGYFHKRNCRIQMEKTDDSPTQKSYLIQLVLFSSEMKLRSDLSDIHFLKIPNLKTLWVDDKEFQKSLNAGEFSPSTERNQLIKSFATKAEVIISGLRLDYDSDLVEELIFPLTFDLKFLVKSSRRSTVSKTDEKEETKNIDKAKLQDKDSSKGTGDNGLPWNYGTKFLDKTKVDGSAVNKADGENAGQKFDTKDDEVSGKEPKLEENDFQEVKPHIKKPDDFEPVKYTVSKTSGEHKVNSESSNKFTEVKSKTESYRKKDKSKKRKDDRYDKYSSLKYSNDKAFTDRKNYLPLVAIITFIVIALFVVYIYFIKDSTTIEKKEISALNIQPPQNLNVINRDYKFIVSYPYPKLGIRIDMGGFSKNVFSISELKSVTNKKFKPPVKTKSNLTKTTINNVESVKPKEEKPVESTTENVSENSEKNENRIFLYKKFYVVYIGTYSSREAADRVADKYFNLGYNAIVNNLETREGKIVYKLSVGDFTSEEFARQFLEKYIK